MLTNILGQQFRLFLLRMGVYLTVLVDDAYWQHAGGASWASGFIKITRKRYDSIC